LKEFTALRADYVPTTCRLRADYVPTTCRQYRFL